eukprot:TRINITY_DN3254_c0_g2_i1.p1 TRINITY_DN3254_c0_g2~~TRINITY_DN3254_c0_g2_i1.p1  ORF type:complete len:460 (+),score=129.37 TRINITY_DN3254_c0_g2_i1:51-1430(+)
MGFFGQSIPNETLYNQNMEYQIKIDEMEKIIEIQKNTIDSLQLSINSQIQLHDPLINSIEWLINLINSYKNQSCSIYDDLIQLSKDYNILITNSIEVSNYESLFQHSSSYEYQFNHFIKNIRTQFEDIYLETKELREDLIGEDMFPEMYEKNEDFLVPSINSDKCMKSRIQFAQQILKKLENIKIVSNLSSQLKNLSDLYYSIVRKLKVDQKTNLDLNEKCKNLREELIHLKSQDNSISSIDNNKHNLKLFITTIKDENQRLKELNHEYFARYKAIEKEKKDLHERLIELEMDLNDKERIITETTEGSEIQYLGQVDVIASLKNENTELKDSFMSINETFERFKTKYLKLANDRAISTNSNVIDEDITHFKELHSLLIQQTQQNCKMKKLWENQIETLKKELKLTQSRLKNKLDEIVQLKTTFQETEMVKKYEKIKKQLIITTMERNTAELELLKINSN